jgi:hypothetical protein
VQKIISTPPRIIFDEQIYAFYLEKNGYDENIIKRFNKKNISIAIDALCNFLDNADTCFENTEPIKKTIIFFFYILNNPDKYSSLLDTKQEKLITNLFNIIENILKKFTDKLQLNYELFNILEKEGYINMVDENINNLQVISEKNKKMHSILYILLSHYYKQNWFEIFRNIIQNELKNEHPNSTYLNNFIECLLLYLDPNNQNSSFIFQFNSYLDKKKILDKIIGEICPILEKDDYTKLSLQEKFENILENYSNTYSINPILEYLYFSKSYPLLFKLLEKNITDYTILLNKFFEPMGLSLYFQDDCVEKLETVTKNLMGIINFIKNKFEPLTFEVNNKLIIKKQIEKFFNLITFIEKKNNLDTNFNKIYKNLNTLKDLFLEMETIL